MKRAQFIQVKHIVRLEPFRWQALHIWTDRKIHLNQKKIDEKKTGTPKVYWKSVEESEER